jgi:hypothetical protein
MVIIYIFIYLFFILRFWHSQAIRWKVSYLGQGCQHWSKVQDPRKGTKCCSKCSNQSTSCSSDSYRSKGTGLCFQHINSNCWCSLWSQENSGTIFMQKKKKKFSFFNKKKKKIKQKN